MSVQSASPRSLTSGSLSGRDPSKPLPRSGRARGPRQHGRLAPYAFLAPAVLLVVALLYAPFVWTIGLSFTRYDGLSPAEWVAFDNYSKLFSDPAFWTSMRNTLLWVVGTIALPVLGGLVVAVLSYDLRAGRWLRLPLILPYTLSGATVAVVWSFILQNGGAANTALGTLGLPGGDTSFLATSPGNTIAMIVASSWQSLGVNALLFIVGLQSVPREPVEAAMLDGARGWRMFRYITWPLLRPITTVVVGLAIVASLKTFDIVWVMTQGGPGRSSETLAVGMYRDSFVGQTYGYGAAVAVILCIVAGGASFLYLRRQLRPR